MNAQNITVEIQGSKTYPENIDIAYFNIDGINTQNEAKFVEKELRNNTSVNRFFVYEKKDGVNRGMIECKTSFDQKELEKAIDLAIVKYRKELEQTEINKPLTGKK